MATARKPATIDGRRLRSERTRQFIIDAYLALLSESARPPTALQIAERAGYSVRSIFERFPDLLALSLAAADHAFVQANTEAAVRNTDADRATRIRTQVETRATVCERWLPLWRTLNANQHQSEALRQRIGAVRTAMWQRLEIMYQPELVSMAEPGRMRILVALEAITDFESWARMRGLYGLSFDQACTVWTRAIDRLLPLS